MNVAELIFRRNGGSGATALIEPENDRAIGFDALENRSRSLAAAIRNAGTEVGDRCAIVSRNSIEYFEIYLACALSGTIAHGLNWRLSAPAMRDTIADSSPTIVFYHAEFRELLDGIADGFDGVEWVEFDSGADSAYEDMIGLHRPSDLPDLPDDADRPFVIMYTGGTSGDSKGAVHSHSTVLTAMANNTIAERIVPTDRYMLLGQAFHSAAVLALNYLCNGCPVVVMNFEPATAMAAIEQHRVTAFLGFPAMLNYMLEEGQAADTDLSSLRNIQYGGGLWAPPTIEGLLDHFPCDFIQCYGTTESVGVTFLTQEDHRQARAGKAELLTTVGRAAFLTEIAIREGEDAGKGAVGEVMVRSASNMLGYWRDYRAEMKPAAPEWLPTGDSGFIDEHGYLHLVGRSKDVIISGGENIYSGQVENSIHGHPGVLETAVVGVDDEHWGESVKAYVVLRESFRGEVDAEAIRETVKRDLGSYQKPKFVEFVDSLPKAPTGKVMKHLLQKQAREESTR